MSATSPSSLAISPQRPDPGSESPAAAALAPSRKKGASGPPEAKASAFTEILSRLRSSLSLGEPRVEAKSPTSASSGAAAQGPAAKAARSRAGASVAIAEPASSDGATRAAAARAKAAPKADHPTPVADPRGAAAEGARPTRETLIDRQAAKAATRGSGSPAKDGDDVPAGRPAAKRGAPSGNVDEKDASLLGAVAASKGASARGAPAAAGTSGPSAAGDAASADPVKGAGSAGKKGAEPTLSVLDLRRSVEGRRAETAKGGAGPAAEDLGADAKRDQAPRNETAKTLDLGSAWGTSADRAAGTPAAFEAPSRAEGAADFRSLLAERLQESWNGEIVKSAHIVLRDGDSGTIRLRLKPESLGNVKIELNLSDNNISGRTVVESDEAKSAFERNMAELADAFKQGGFDSARLEVSVGSGSGGGSPNGDAGSGPFYSERLRSASSSSAEPATAVAAYSRPGGSVDIFA